MTSDMHSALRADPGDRELLELAAKAAGLVFAYGYDKNAGFLYFPPRPADWPCALPPSGRHWNPLIDDGDALRLAVKLKLNITFVGSSVFADWNCKDSGPTGHGRKSDGEKATRYAIVRAAAAIGAVKQE